MTFKAYEDTYQGEKAIWLQAGPYVAAVLPEIGANLIAFRDTEKHYHFLHEPTIGEMDDFKARPIAHGIPVLYPPNRYEDGKFPWNGKVYQFPVNEEATGNHLHGFVHSTPWAVEKFGADETESRVTLSLRVREGHEVYTFLPHDFTIRLTYSLSLQGLHQQISLHNEGKDRLPGLIAFHTAINAPFVPGSEAADYGFKLTIGHRWQLDERMLPTGEFQPLTADEEQMKIGGLNPYFAAMDNHYTAVPQNGRNYMELIDSRAGVKLVYDVGTSYKQWMIWNGGGGGFFCPEPQMNLVNAPNVKMPAEQIGLIALEPGDVWEETARLYSVELAQ